MAEIIVEVIPMNELFLVDLIVGCVGMLFETVGDGVPAEIVEESFVMFLTAEKLWTADVILGDRYLLVVDIVLAAVLKDCVMLLPQFSSQQNALIS